jgi:ATP-dependent protease Clp ATPase subunit
MAINNTYYCSFCGKSDKEAEMLVAGPYPHAICPDCINLCDDVVKAKRIEGAVRDTTNSKDGSFSNSKTQQPT